MPELNGPPEKRHSGICPTCRKLRYPDRNTARRAARALHPGAVLRAYRCGDWWHLGNTPPAVKHGYRNPLPGINSR